MRTFIGISAFFVSVALLAAYQQNPQGGEPIVDLPGAGKVKMTGPYVHKNLAIYLLHRTAGQDPEGDYLTLEEAMASGSVVLTEKSGVRTLEIENKSDKPVFIQGGDVVKGGQQDRTIPTTFVLPAKSGKVDIAAFCVEHGRWSGERQFAASAGQLYTKECKLAARDAKDQQKVWTEVARAKAILGDKAATGKSSTDSINEEYEKAKAQIEEFADTLSKTIENAPDAIGLAYGINGKLDGVELYESHKLLLKMHKKVLRACGAEAIAKFDEKKSVPAQELKACAETLKKLAAEPAPASETALPAENRARTLSNKEQATFEHSWNGRIIHQEMLTR